MISSTLLMEIVMRFYLLILISVLVVSISAGSVYSQNKEAVPGSWQKNSVQTDGGSAVTVSMYFPKSYKAGMSRTLILLHSYGKSSYEWEKTSGASKLADTYGIILVCPDMGKTIYENDYFDETSNRWNAIPGGRWIPQVLIPYLRKEKDLCNDRKLTGITGLEIGARGALLSAARNPEIFGFAGGISGMYDSGSATRFEGYNLLYGKYKDNKDRWENADSIIILAPQLSKTVIFLSHGNKERNPSIDQTQLVLIRLAQLKKKQGGFQYRFFEKGWGDSWAIWGPSLLECFKDFDAAAPAGAVK
jgi:enterochelin esterase-like enzyme